MHILAILPIQQEETPKFLFILYIVLYTTYLSNISSYPLQLLLVFVLPRRTICSDIFFLLALYFMCSFIHNLIVPWFNFRYLSSKKSYIKTLIGLFYKNEEIGYFLQFIRSILCAYERMTYRCWYHVSLTRLMYTPPCQEKCREYSFFTIYLTPNWSSRMVGTTCSGTPVLSSRLSYNMCSGRME